MKVAVAVLLAIVLALASGLIAETMRNSRQQSEIAELTSKIGDRTARENLELQEKCSIQAGKVFRQSDKEMRQSVFGLSVHILYHVYTSHYNVKLNKCFILREYLTSFDLNALPETSSDLFDAYEQRLYASYVFTPDKVKAAWEVPPKACKLIASSAEETPCKSKQEFDAFTARYME